jgi:hypothetical protein
MARLMLLDACMKTTIQFLILSLVMVLAATGCGKKSSSTPNYYTSGYGAYQMIGGQCMQTGTNQVVQPQYCQNQGYGGYPGQYPGQVGAAKQCYGQYIFMGYGYPQQGTCNGQNCAGYQLQEVATGQQVNCI